MMPPKLDFLSLKMARPLQDSVGEFVRRNNLVFVHIPKTAGSSFVSYLSGFYNYSQILPVDLKETSPFHWSRYEVERASFFKGHFYYRDVKEVVSDAHYITFLRDPVDRVVSEYWHLRTDSAVNFACSNDLTNEQKNYAETALRAAEMTLKEWVEAQEVDGLCYRQNMQVKFLAEAGRGMPREEANRMETDEGLELAKFNLTQRHVFFGITEEYELSKHLFAYTFGLPGQCISSREHLNCRPRQNHVEKLGQDTIEMIANQNKDDYFLYEHAKVLFMQRYQLMMSRLMTDEVATRLGEDGVEQMFNVGHTVREIQLIADESLVCSGFFETEIFDRGIPFRWTGAEKKATLDIKIELSSLDKLCVRMKIVFVANESALRTLQISFDGTLFEEVRQDKVGGLLQYSGAIIVTEAMAAKKIHQISIESSRHLPAGAKHNKESRLLGLAIHKITITASKRAQ